MFTYKKSHIKFSPYTTNYIGPPCNGKVNPFFLMAKSKSLCQTLLPKMWKRHSEPWRWCTPFAFCKDLTTQYWNLGHFQPNQTNLQYKIRRETYTKNHQGTHHTQQIHHIPFCYHLKTISFPKQQRINPVSYNKSFVGCTYYSYSLIS